MLFLQFRCLEKCTTAGTEYYGLIFAKQCSCGDDKPLDQYKKSESHCNEDCPGDQSAKCGGTKTDGTFDNRVNIYQIGAAAATTTTPAPSSFTTAGNQTLKTVHMGII